MIEKEEIFKYRLKLSNSDAKLIHHEVRRSIKNALLGSGLKYAQNKTWPRMFFGPSFAEVFKTKCEFVDICLTQKTSVEDIKQKLSDVLPDIFKVEEIRAMPNAFSSVEKLAAYAAYHIKGVRLSDAEIRKNIKAGINLVHPNGMRETVDISPIIKDIKRVSENEIEIIIPVAAAVGSISLKQAFMMLLGLDVDLNGAEIVRSALLWQDSLGNLQIV